jgi:hypothetical protein
MLGKFTKRALLGGLVLVTSTVFAATAFAEASVSGWIKFDAGMDMGDRIESPVDRTKGSSTTFTTNDFAKNKVDGGIWMQVTETRFRFTSSNDSDMGKVTTNFEAHVWNYDHAATFTGSSQNIRHAYVTVGNLLMGQTWSTFMGNLVYAAETVDFAGQAGAYFVRQPQVRYTLPLEGIGKLAIALETGDRLTTVSSSINASATLTAGDGAGNAVTEVETKTPDIVASLTANVGPGVIVVDVLSDTTRVADSTGTADASTSVTVFNVMGKFGLGGKNNVKFMVGSGGNTSYMPFMTKVNVVLNDAGDGVTLEAKDKHQAINAALQWWLDDVSRINVAYGSLAITFDADVAPGTARTNSRTSTHINYVRDLTPTVNLGVEYLTMAEAKESGKGFTGETDDSMSRLQVGVRAMF